MLRTLSYMLYGSALAVALLVPTEGVRAQDAPPEDAPAGGGDRPRVFWDCQGPQCDNTYYRTEIPWVTWVRDQADAHLHIIMTSQGTGSGGREYQIDIMGRAPYEDYQDQRFYQVLPTDTDRERLDGVAFALAVTLADFAQFAGFQDIVRFEPGIGGGQPAAVGLVSAEEVEDPWNLWVFRIFGNGNFNGESTQENRSFFGGFNASRVTPTWKQNYSFNTSYNYQERELSSGSTFTDERTDYNFNTTVVYSLADHWSVGFTTRVGRNTRQNTKRDIQVTPAIEYSFFPYEEATRRSLTAFYQIGPENFQYFEETQDNELSETRYKQQLSIDFSQRQPWGDASVELIGSHYLHDFDRHNMRVQGNISFRITRGLDVNFGANYSVVADQLYLPLADLSDEEILTGARRVATDKEWGVSFGMSYQFGSIFNNVVNNRFPGGGGPGGGGGMFRGGGGFGG